MTPWASHWFIAVPLREKEQFTHCVHVHLSGQWEEAEPPPKNLRRTSKVHTERPQAKEHHSTQPLATALTTYANPVQLDRGRQRFALKRTFAQLNAESLTDFSS